MAIEHVIVFANGELLNPQSAREMAARADLIVAADGGLAHVQALGLKPDLLVGDLDSVTTEQISWAETMGASVRRYPIEKDETDLELALHEAVESGCRRVTITGALGGRLDQTLSNIYLLNLPVLADVDARIDDGDQEVILIHSAVDLEGRPGDTVSLLPLSPIVRGITSSGLKYPLIDESLIFYRSRGVSNEMEGTRARVEIQSGILLCIHARGQVLP